jgi:hypothetical protein
MIERAQRYLFRRAEPSETAPWWDAGGGLFTLLYWAGIAVFIAALFRQKFLPFVEYPQHLAIASLLRRMAHPTPQEAALFQTALSSFNSLFHITVALLAFVMPIERAGEAGVALIFVLWAIAVLQLLKAAGRPRARAFLFMPLLPCSTLAWGYVSFGMALAIQMIVLARVIQTGRVPPERRVSHDAITALLAVLGMWSHVMASLFAYTMILIAIIAGTSSRARDTTFARRFAAALRTGLPLLPAAVYAYWSYKGQVALARYTFGVGLRDSDSFALAKITTFHSRLTALRADRLDAYVASAATALLILSAFLRVRSRRPIPAALWLLPASLVLYLMIPLKMWGSFYVYPRLGIIVALATLLFLPQPRRQIELGFSTAFCAIGLFTAGWFYALLGAGRTDYDDLDRLINEAPRGRKVAGLIFDQELPDYHLSVLCHAAAYYNARKGGELAISFARHPSFPVHYKPGKKPPETPVRFEWEPASYKPGTPYAKYFDTLLVRTDEKGEDPRIRLFGPGAAQIKVLSHHGRWWLLATRP